MNSFAERYQKKSAYELAQLAAHGVSLVPEAREALDAEIAGRSLPPLRPQDQTLGKALVPAKDKLDEVGGWLFLYCLGLIISSIRLAIDIGLAITAHIGIPFVLALFLIGVVIWNIATSVAIFLRARFALSMVFDQLILTANAAAFYLGIGFARLYFLNQPEGAGTQVFTGILAVAEFAIWYRYFRVSKRVRTTLGRNL